MRYMIASISWGSLKRGLGKRDIGPYKGHIGLLWLFLQGGFWAPLKMFGIDVRQVLELILMRTVSQDCHTSQ